MSMCPDKIMSNYHVNPANLDWLSLRAVAVEPPGVAKCGSIRTECPGGRLLVILRVRIVVSAQSLHLASDHPPLTLFAHWGRRRTVTLLPRSQVTTSPRSATSTAMESPRCLRAIPWCRARTFTCTT